MPELRNNRVGLFSLEYMYIFLNYLNNEYKFKIYIF